MRFQATVEEVMNTNVKTVDIDDPIKKAAEIMSKYNIGSVAVVGGKHLKGILTAEDIVQKHVAEGRGQKVGDVMTHDPVTITPEKTIEDASRLMSEYRIKKLPVMNGDKIIGVITASDIIRVEPALYENLLEHLKIERPEMVRVRKALTTDQCEVCGNYSDDITEVNGVWTCEGCRE